MTLIAPAIWLQRHFHTCSFNILVHSTYFFCSDLMWYVYRRWDWIWSWKPISLWLLWHHPEVSLLPSTFSPPPSSHPFFTYHVFQLPAQGHFTFMIFLRVLISYWSIWWLPDVYSQLRLYIQSSASHLNTSLEPQWCQTVDLTMLCPFLPIFCKL